jgi:hypothetical protein
MKKRRVETDTHLGHFACIDEDEKSLKQIPNLAILLCIDEEEKSLKQIPTHLLILFAVKEKFLEGMKLPGMLMVTLQCAVN